MTTRMLRIVGGIFFARRRRGGAITKIFYCFTGACVSRRTRERGRRDLLVLKRFSYAVDPALGETAGVVEEFSRRDGWTLGAGRATTAGRGGFGGVFTAFSGGGFSLQALRLEFAALGVDLVGE